MTISPQLRHKIGSVVGELRQELFGEKGCPQWGTKFAQMEFEATEIGDAVTCELLRQVLEMQAVVEEESCLCGVCGEATVPHPDGMAPQAMTTGRGEVTWNAPQRLCNKCRQAFFPSAPSARASR